MRFSTGESEAGYAQQLTQMLPGALFQLAFLVCFVCSVNFLMFDWDQTQYHSQAGYEIRMIQAHIVGAIIVLSVCVMILTRCFPNLFARRFAFLREMLVVLMVSLLTLAPIACTPYYMTKAMGLDVFEVWGDDSELHTESPMLLCMQSLITGSHLKLPIRWCSLSILEVVGILYYAVCTFGIGSPERHVSYVNTVFHVSLIICAALGKRQAEGRDRESYVKIATEITRRAEVEFKLAKLARAEEGSRRRADSGQAASSEGGSVPTTTDTGFQFQSMEREQGTGLNQVIDLGLREGWLVAEHELQIRQGQLLGSGGFGVVVAGIFNGTPVAVKVSKIARPDAQRLNWFAALADEIRVLRKLRHPHIVLFHGACFGTDGVLLVLGLINGETLARFSSRCADRLAKIPPAGPPPHRTDIQRCEVLAGICRAFVYLHTRNPSIIHGDLKPSNVMVEHHATGPCSKLLDFGLSRIVTRTSKIAGGTMRWMAPEVIAAVTPKRPDPKMDIYSFGCLAFFVATNSTPLADMTDRAIRVMVKRNQTFDFDMAKYTDPFSVQCGGLVEMCVGRDPRTRPTIQKVYEAIVAMHVFHGMPVDGVCALRSGRQLWKDAAVIYDDWVRSKQRPRAGPWRRFRLGAGGASSSMREQSCLLGPVPEDLPAPALRDGATANVAAVPLLVPQAAPSEPWAMKLSLMNTLVTWNCRVERPVCCHYHRMLNALLDVTRDLKKRECQHFSYDSFWQCPKCSLLVVGDGEGDAEHLACNFCGHTVDKASSHAAGLEDSESATGLTVSESQDGSFASASKSAAEFVMEDVIEQL